MPEFSEENARRVMLAKIEKNGHEPLEVIPVQKGTDAYLCTVRFTDDDDEYVGVVTRAEVEAIEG